MIERLQQDKRVVAGAWAIGLFIAAVLPLRASAYWEEVLINAALFALLAMGLNVVVGLAGLLDLGYVAFWAIGAYTVAIFSGAGPLKFVHLSTWQILPLGVAFAMLAGVILGLPVLRLRGDYLAIVTLGFGEIIRITASNLDGITRGPQGIAGVPHPRIGGYDFGVNPVPYYYWVVAVVIVMMLVIRRLDRSRIGRAWVAIREDEVAAEAMGINTFRMKLWAFAIGASTAGFAGVIQGSKISYVSPQSFQIIVSILILSMVVLGGMGSTFGPIAGAIIITVAPELLREAQDYRFLLFGAVLVIMMVFRPEGIFPSRRVAAEQHGIGVAGDEKTGVEMADEGSDGPA
ncbi:MAG: branched-chain amino acid ABC transporter permease [Actinomycetota bacterium]